ncbi:hypothetical protein KH5H1_69030 [Corallococcus caeni]|nr:hypothetical protein KH5H1_69030 [Corallococcus sp. KH5-1]
MSRVAIQAPGPGPILIPAGPAARRAPAWKAYRRGKPYLTGAFPSDTGPALAAGGETQARTLAESKTTHEGVGPRPP